MTPHPSPALIARYADREARLDEATMWSLEVHLETCAACRSLVAAGVPAPDRDRLDRVAAALDRAVTAGPAPVRRRRLRTLLDRWAAGYLVAWIVMSVAVVGCAVLLEVLAPALPSMVTLLAPVAPLPAVAVAWSRRYDPAWELIAGTPVAGLTVLLRRTAAVLVVIVPALALASGGAGVSLALTLLPCLAFTAASIALGAFVGVRRAATGIAAAWTLAVVAPAVWGNGMPALLQPAALPGWAALTVVLAGFAATRAATFRRSSGLD